MRSKIGFLSEKISYMEREIRDKFFDEIVEFWKTEKSNIKDVRREATVSWSGHRADILIEKKNGEYIIFEVKPCNRTRDRHGAISAIGQILLYREFLSQKRDVPREWIKLAIVSDFFSDEVIQIIGEYDLPIELVLAGDRKGNHTKEETA